jgi:hypothetical protein
MITLDNREQDEHLAFHMALDGPLFARAMDLSSRCCVSY